MTRTGASQRRNGTRSGEIKVIGARRVKEEGEKEIVLYCIFVLLEENIADRTQQMEQVILTKVNSRKGTLMLGRRG